MPLPRMMLPALGAKPMIDTRTPLLAYAAGEKAQDQHNQQMLARRVGGYAAAGDYLGAAQEAMAGGDIRTGSALEAFQRKRQMDLVGALQSAAGRVKTPEQRAAFLKTVEGAFGPEAAAAYADPRSWPAALSEMDRLKAGKYRAETAKLQAEADAYKGGGYKNQKERTAVAGGMRKEYTALAAPYRLLRSSYEKMQGLYDKSKKQATGAGDIAIIYNYMKMLDPTSAILPGEYATAKNTGSIPEAIWNRYNQAKDGTYLGPPGSEQRRRFFEASNIIYQTEQRKHRERRQQHRELAVRNGIDPDNVTIDPDITITELPPRKRRGSGLNPGFPDVPDVIQGSEGAGPGGGAGDDILASRPGLVPYDTPRVDPMQPPRVAPSMSVITTPRGTAFRRLD